ncbi:Ig-like domain-containing protein [Acetohalobium arabaticum]|uniref:SbsA Ig-like domain-containing protein n=1 Tax=Acetohalobium arabaticum (strain ATCC 49924 / DSM 5501 / Z-7288) TaxID=574087 RepID=D9QSG6_ACEAZ|nr:Ig-like domain-containing protein [Acetohalobium arabaticum]ADL13429.1 hypothetical protein Acear_1928 [Acetohalobium arabaticum DSM 5501]
MKRKFIIILILLLIFLLSGCSSILKNFKDETPPKIVKVQPTDGAKDVDISSEIKVYFNEKLAENSIKSSILLIRKDTGKVMEADVSYKNKVITLDPKRKYVDIGNKIVLRGVKTGLEYQIFIKDDIKDDSGNSLKENHSFEFKTSDLDYGLYWFGPNGECEKYVDGRKNEYYDPQKPVVIYSHGWQPGLYESTFTQDQPYIRSTHNYSINTGKIWRKKGYNIGAWMWGQFAAEGFLEDEIIRVEDAEAKIWFDKNIRYKVRNGSYRYFNQKKSVHEIFYDTYIKALRNNTNENIRLVGHSIGNQVVITLAHKISNNIKENNLDSHYMPKRIALLDPYWSNSHFSNGKSIANVISDYAMEMATKNDVVIENYRTTKTSTLIGDLNYALQDIAAVYRVNAGFLDYLKKLTKFRKEHNYATTWYFWSMKYDIPANNNGVIGARASNYKIKQCMNIHRNSTWFWKMNWFGVGNMAGEETPSPYDDEFTMESGVISAIGN